MHRQRKVAMCCGVSIAAAAAVVIGVIVAESGTSAPHRGVISPRLVPATTTSAGSAVSSPDTVAASSVIPEIFHRRGSGAATTSSFAVSSNWHLTYSFDCSRSGGVGIFVVQAARPPGEAGIAADPPIDLSGTVGKGSQSYSVGGVVVLDIASDCSWSLDVPGWPTEAVLH
jgi:hypothetical protein